MNYFYLLAYTCVDPSGTTQHAQYERAMEQLQNIAPQTYDALKSLHDCLHHYGADYDDGEWPDQLDRDILRLIVCAAFNIPYTISHDQAHILARIVPLP